MTDDVLARARGIRLLGCDVDGVLTDTRIFVDDLGHETKAFCALDGPAIHLLRRAGIEVAWITGSPAPAVMHRARRLKVEQRTLDEARAVPDAGVDRSPQPVEDMARKEEAVALIGAIGRLPERYRDVIRFRYFEGLSCATIARRLGTSPNVVSLILFRARQRLREELDPS
jgi:RNA polymerase sigma factor (sigma-70 family)